MHSQSVGTPGVPPCTLHAAAPPYLRPRADFVLGSVFRVFASGARIAHVVVGGFWVFLPVTLLPGALRICAVLGADSARPETL